MDSQCLFAVSDLSDVASLSRTSDLPQMVSDPTLAVKFSSSVMSWWLGQPFATIEVAFPPQLKSTITPSLKISFSHDPFLKKTTKLLVPVGTCWTAEEASTTSLLPVCIAVVWLSSISLLRRRDSAPWMALTRSLGIGIMAIEGTYMYRIAKKSVELPQNPDIPPSCGSNYSLRRVKLLISLSYGVSLCIRITYGFLLQANYQPQICQVWSYRIVDTCTFCDDMGRQK